MGMEPEEIVRYRDEKEVQEEEKVEEIVFLENREHNEEAKKVNLGRKVCTDMKSNRRVFLPKGRPVREESNLETRNQAWSSVWKEYRKENWLPNGSQEHLQLTKEEIAGKVSLSKRVAAKELYIGQSDKGKGLVIMKPETYSRCRLYTQKETRKFPGSN